MRARTPTTIWIVLGLWGGGVAAQPADRARADFEQAAALYRAGVFDKSAALFESSWNARPDPVTALNLAQALEGAGRPAEALRWYDRLLAEETDVRRREAAEAGRTHVRAHGFLHLRCAPLDAEVIAGEKRGRCPDWRVYLPAGPARLTLRAEGRPDLEHALVVPTADRVEVRVEMPAAAPPVVAPAIEPAARVDVDEVEPPPTSGWKTTAGWAALGAGAVGLGVGTWGYLAARGDAADATGDPDPGAVAADRALRDDFDTHQTIAWVGLGVGAALAATGAALLLWPEEGPHVAPSGRGLTLGGRF